MKSNGLAFIATCAVIGGTALWLSDRPGSTSNTSAALATSAPSVPSDPLTSIVNDVVSSGDARPTVKRVGNNLDVSFSVDPWALTRGTTKSQFFYMSSKMFRRLFQADPSLDRISILGTVTLVDVKGNKSQGDGFTLAMLRKNNASINWDNFRSENLPRVTDSSWIHPGFRGD
jgi:hypothetical protein